MKEPTWHNVHYPPIDYQNIIYYSAPKQKTAPKSLEEVDPELLKTYAKLGIPLAEQKMLAGVAVDAVFDSVSVATTFKAKLAELGIIFCSFSEAVLNHPDLIRKYLGSVVPYSDNFFATLNSAVFSDGSFVYIPKGVRCPMELSTYFRINAMDTGQFERTLIIADEGAQVSYLEGCTAPIRDTNQLHAAVVGLVALNDATIKYSTVQNWYPGDKEGKGGIYNFVTKRGRCLGVNSKISWTQVETGSAITWKYRAASCRRQFHRRVLFGGGDQQLPAGGHRHQDDPHREEHPQHHRDQGDLRGPRAEHLPGPGEDTEGRQCGTTPGATRSSSATSAGPTPYIEVKNSTSRLEHEASTSKIGEDQIFYCRQRGISTEDAVNMIVNGFCKEVFRELPMEFAVEAQKLLGVSLEGSVG
jgi:Fe-S cluster assembly protein SufB